MRNPNIDDFSFITDARKSRRIPERKVTDLEYSDDISLLECETKNAQMQLNALSDVAKEIGLLIDINKTKVLPKQHQSNT